jgi:hypothetical protein
MALSMSRSTASIAPSGSAASTHARRPAARAALATASAAPTLAPVLQDEAQAQLALNELFPHLRLASDAALRDIFVSLRVPARAGADA